MLSRSNKLFSLVSVQHCIHKLSARNSMNKWGKVSFQSADSNNNGYFDRLTFIGPKRSHSLNIYFQDSVHATHTHTNCQSTLLLVLHLPLSQFQLSNTVPSFKTMDFLAFEMILWQRKTCQLISYYHVHDHTSSHSKVSGTEQEYLLSKAKVRHNLAVTKWMGDCKLLGFAHYRISEMSPESNSALTTEVLQMRW